MEIRPIRESLKQVGSIALQGKSERELIEIACALSTELDDTERKFLSATSTYCETGAKTEWRVWEKSTAMRQVWIVKKVTRYSDTDDPKVEEQHVMLIDRALAEQFVALLNTQVNPVF
jgi:hypothetical protein